MSHQLVRHCLSRGIRRERVLRDGKTAALPDPDEEPDPSPPAKPLDLTVELASDTNDLVDDTGVSAQGIYLTWNEPVDSEPAIDSYRIEYKRMNTGNPNLDRTEWEQVNTTPIVGETSFTHDVPLAKDAEVRMYRVGSKANAVGELNYTDPVEFRLHPDMHKPSAPQMVTATADSDTEVTVSWMVPADNGGSAITGFTVRWKQSDAASYADADMAMADATASSHMVTGLTGSTSYDFQVIATNAKGDSYPSMAATTMTMATVTEVTEPSNVMAASNAAGELTLTWEGAANAESYILIAVHSTNFTYERTDVSDGAARSGTVTGLTSGANYIGIVVALKGSGDDLEVLHASTSAMLVQ